MRHRVDQRLLGGVEQRVGLRARARVAHGHHLDRLAVLVLDAGRYVLQSRTHRTVRRGALLIQPFAQLAFLLAGQREDHGRVVAVQLDQRQRLQHAIVQMGGHVGALLLALLQRAFGAEIADQRNDPRHDGQTHAGQQRRFRRMPQRFGDALVHAGRRRPGLTAGIAQRGIAETVAGHGGVRGVAPRQRRLRVRERHGPGRGDRVPGRHEHPQEYVGDDAGAIHERRQYEQQSDRPYRNAQMQGQPAADAAQHALPLGAHQGQPLRPVLTGGLVSPGGGVSRLPIRGICGLLVAVRWPIVLPRSGRAAVRRGMVRPAIRRLRQGLRLSHTSIVPPPGGAWGFPSRSSGENQGVHRYARHAHAGVMEA